jgi:lipopolysaccharide transport system ATP-binding protein
MSDIAIRIENLSKKYVIGAKDDRFLYERISNGLKSLFSRNGKQQETEFWALRDINLEIKQGDVVGIIGKNGAGKSTLLKIISRITQPTTGRIMIKGKVASILEVGTGMNRELTGRENIFINGAILGMKQAEIRRKFDEIVAFSGVEKFIDTPIKHYSSGMYVRLAFAIAAHLEPDILIIDEVLAVGDAEFQKKCLGKMEESSTWSMQKSCTISKWKDRKYG